MDRAEQERGEDQRGRRLQVQSSIHCWSTPRKMNSSARVEHQEEAEEVAGELQRVARA